MTLMKLVLLTLFTIFLEKHYYLKISLLIWLVTASVAQLLVCLRIVTQS